MSATGPASKIPALLNAMCMPPWRSTVVLTSRATSSDRDTSVTTALPCPPAASISATVCSSGPGRRPATTTLAPSPAKASAAARPIPLPPPVTRVTLFVNRALMLDLPSGWVGHGERVPHLSGMPTTMPRLG